MAFSTLNTFSSMATLCPSTRLSRHPQHNLKSLVVRKQVVARRHPEIWKSKRCRMLGAQDEKFVSVEEDPSLFFEPLVRTFFLGIGAGVLCEAVHVSLKFAEKGAELPAELFTTINSLVPITFWDHFAALLSWVLFYSIEAGVVYAIMQKYGNDTTSVARALKSTRTLPKRILPLNLNTAKRFFVTMLARQRRTPAFEGASSSQTRSLPSPSPSKSVLPANSNIVTLAPPKTSTSSPPATLPPARQLPSVSTPTRQAKSLEEKKSSLEGLMAPRGTPGITRPDAPPLSKRDKELRDRNAYLKNFWYAAGLSQELKDSPKEVTLFGRKLVLWRDERGNARCMEAACPHRGAPLSKGWTKDINGQRTLVCPYHGWAFDSAGCLKEVPSNSENCTYPKRPLVDAYPVVERGGFIWLFYGSRSLPVDERPPIPFCSELEDPKWKAVYGELEFECGHHSVFENAIDMAHIHYLHGDSFGNSSKPEINDMKVNRHTFHIDGTFSIHNKPVSPIWNFTSVPEVPVEYRAYLPSTSYVRIQLGAGISMITFVSTVPISATRSVNRFCLIRNFAQSDLFDGWARRSMFRILGEDKVMVEKLHPEDVPTEISLEADRPQIAFRRLRQEWVDMGYGASPESTLGHAASLFD